MRLLAIAFCALILAGVSSRAESPTASSLFSWDGVTPTKVYHLYSGSDGLSHLETIDLPLMLGRDGNPRFFAQNVSAAYIGSSPPKELGPWHYAINQHLIISIQGNLQFDLGDGKEYLLRPGEAVLAEDWTGKGHRSGCDVRNKGRCVSIDIEVGPIARTYPLRTPPSTSPR